jgi:hypothetical protein
MTEQEYKKYIYDKANEVKNKKDLDKLLREVIKSKDLDYGKIVYAICGCMIATCNYIDRSQVGGITGFQAGFIGWEMIKEYTITFNNQFGMKILNYGDLLYPQSEERFEKTLDKDTWEALRKKAYENMKDSPNAHPKVFNHWKSIVRGEVPFGFVVKENEDE